MTHTEQSLHTTTAARAGLTSLKSARVTVAALWQSTRGGQQSALLQPTTWLLATKATQPPARVQPDTNHRRLGAVCLTALTAAGCILLLSACATGAVPTRVVTPAPLQWYATQAHSGSLTDLSSWWRQQNDPLLVELIDAAQAVSPSVAAARFAIEQARASRTVSQGALLPTLDAVASVNRSVAGPASQGAATAGSFAQTGLQTRWELDLFGANAASRSASQARFEGTQSQWHDARVLVAAEVAAQYYSLLTCEKLGLLAQADAQSRAENAQLDALATTAGLQAPASTALARASAAEGQARATQQRAQCNTNIKALVALTALGEPQLREKLAAPDVQNPAGSVFISIPSVPADVLAQRPDVFNAERDVVAASFEIKQVQAQRYPRLSLMGNITANTAHLGGISQGFNTWSIGPLAVSVPLFDGATSQAKIELAKANYERAASNYRSTSRQAVQEVEQALVRLQSTKDRTSDAAQASQGYQAFFAATQARYNAGLTNLVALEEARRILLAAQSALLGLELERRLAWVTLYRALGGGWSTAALDAPPAIPAPPAPPAAPAALVTR